MNIEQDIQLLSQNLKKDISFESYLNIFSETYYYSLFPTGKLFRPLLVLSIMKDKSISEEYLQNFLYLSSFVEIHHTYTLNHDDMPCMDNDDTRRGRPSIHKKFTPWHALLSGDGLLNASYSILAKINSTELKNLFKYTTWCLGPKGLILGQALDLSEEISRDFNSLLLTHKLKTGRLIQVSLVGALLLTGGQNQLDFKEIKSIHRLGEKIGITFQLFDDLSELANETLSSREAKINPWIKYNKESRQELNKSILYIKSYLIENEMKYLGHLLSEYFKTTKNNLEASSFNIEKHTKNNLNPIISFFDCFPF